MNKSKRLIVGSVALLLFGYCGWTTTRISILESRLAQLESSHQALGRATYNFGTASLRTDKFAGLSGADLARIVLYEMQQDDLLRAAIHSSRSRSMLIHESQSPRNSMEKVSQ
ncbi:MAG: hypothetical protein QOF48_507 [Verrucomicrobiota bacterium]|jgi:hypothetical protein